MESPQKAKDRTAIYSVTAKAHTQKNVSQDRIETLAH
jgi:hypothetical protein